MVVATEIAPECTQDLAELVARAQAGDTPAFDALYHRTVARVYGVCLRMCADVAEAERLTQDAYVLAWQKLHTFRAESAFTTWLHRIAVNAVLEDRRSENRRAQRVMAVDDVALLDRGVTVLQVGERMDLDRAIARLPTGARTVLVLFDVEGYTQEEIARMTGTAVGTVKAQLHRARRLLREWLNR